MTQTTGAWAAGQRERVGWYFYDWANSAFSTTVVVVFLGPYLSAIAENASDADENVHPFGLTVAAGSFYFYCVSLSVFLTVFVLPVVGAIADRMLRKKTLMAVFAYIGAAATVAMLFVAGDRYLLGGGLFIVANIAFGASVVVYYSFLPQLADPDRRDSVSSVGWAIGYLGGGLLLLGNVAAVFVGKMAGWDEGTVVRWCLASAGVWWALFTVIPLRRLGDHPPAVVMRGSVLSQGFRQLWDTLRHLKAFPLTLFFLVAYLIYNDGIQTVINAATVYGNKELGHGNDVLASTVLVIQFLGFGGALMLGVAARRFGAWKTLLVSLLVWITIIGLAYLLPAREVVPFVALGGLIGIVLGGSQALSRSLFSQMIPRGKEAEYFGLYEISDKGTSWLGTLVFALAYDVTRSYRSAIIWLIGFFVIGFLALLAVPVRRAIVAAGNTPPRVL